MTVNGKIFPLQNLETPTLNVLLYYLGCKNQLVAIQVNKKILSLEEQKKVILKENDVVEIIHFVGGG